MKIAIDLTPVYDHMSGIERFSLNIAVNLVKNDADNKYILLFKEKVPEEFLSLSERTRVYVIKKCNKLWFQQIRLMRALYKIDADIYLFPGFVSPVLFRKNKVINTIHDLTCWDCPETIPLKMKYYYRITYRFAVKNSWKLITVSNFSKQRICKRYHLDDDFVILAYNGLSDSFTKSDQVDNTEIKSKYKLPRQYILSLSTIEPRKNIQLLIKAYREIQKEGSAKLPPLVLAGRKGWKINEIISDDMTESEQDITFTGFVDDEDLPALYKGAALFVFPSLYEGFGLPIIEAMSQGTPVLASDAASIPEVIGDAGYMFKSNNLSSLKKQLIELADSGWKDLQTIDKTELMKKYNWEKSAKVILSSIV